MKRKLSILQILLFGLVLFPFDGIAASPVRESALSEDRSHRPLILGLKHYPNPTSEKNPILLLHGLAQNDRIWDSPLESYNFARILYENGYDVWIGNLRNAGTKGFRSETPPGPHHWTIDDYAIFDAPALIQTVREKTGKTPWVIAHSMGAWIMEGYLAGLVLNSDGSVVADESLSLERMKSIRGLITLSGVYGLKWEHEWSDALRNPIRSEKDYYQSNYELELLAQSGWTETWAPWIPEIPLPWIGQLLDLPLNEIPWIGAQLGSAYREFQYRMIDSPWFSLFYYPKNCDSEMVRLETLDSLEDFGPMVLVQMANAIRDRETKSFYWPRSSAENHTEPEQPPYRYGSIRKKIRLPLLFIGAGRDRLASAREVYEEGFLKTESPDKSWIRVEEAGHLDIITGLNAREKVIEPILKWLRSRS